MAARISAGLAALLLCTMAAPVWAQDAAPNPKAAPQEQPKPPAHAKPATSPDEAKPAPESDQGASLRRRRRPKLSPRVPKHAGVVELRVGGFGGFLLGSARKDSFGLLGTRYEFDNDLDLDPWTILAPAEINVHVARRLSIVMDFSWANASGSARTTLQTAFDGLNIPAGSRISADLSILTSSIAARYFASSSARGTFEIEAGVRYLGVAMRISATDAGGGVVGSERETTDSFTPFVGFLATFNVWRWGKETLLLEGHGRLGLLAIGDSSDNQANFYARAYLGLSAPIPAFHYGNFNVRVALGYQWWFIDAERESNNLDEDFEIGFHGPVLRLVIGF